jgi:hypothetical protein
VSQHGIKACSAYRRASTVATKAHHTVGPSELIFAEFCTKYVTVSFSYGLIRTQFKVHDAKIKEYDVCGKETTRPILLTENVAIGFISGLIGLYLAPFLMYSDLCTLEKHLRGFPVTKRENYNSSFDVIFDF